MLAPWNLAWWVQGRPSGLLALDWLAWRFVLTWPAAAGRTLPFAPFSPGGGGPALNPVLTSYNSQIRYYYQELRVQAQLLCQKRTRRTAQVEMRLRVSSAGG